MAILDDHHQTLDTPSTPLSLSVDDLKEKIKIRQEFPDPPTTKPKTIHKHTAYTSSLLR